MTAQIWSTFRSTVSGSFSRIATVSQISFDGTQQAAAPGFTAITPMFSLHNGKAGIGAYGDTLAIDTASINSSQLDMTKVGKYFKFTIGGETFGIPAYALLPTS